jgi:hypothetical protein
MVVRRSVVALIVLQMVSGSAGNLARAEGTPIGVIAGRATDQVKKPYADYVVRVREVKGGDVVASAPLDPQGRFSVGSLRLTTRYVVELYSERQAKLVCTEGPYTLNVVASSKTDVNINCGGSSAAWWLASAIGATTAVIAAVTESGSKKSGKGISGSR